MPRQTKLDLRPPAKDLPELWTPDDIYDAASEEIIVLFDEDSRVDRKSSKIEPRDLGDYFTVYANRPPHGGVIFVGVANNGKIEGCKSLSRERRNELEEAGTVYCPHARFDCRPVEVYNKNGQPDFVLAFRIFYRADKLVENSKGEAFTRSGARKRKLNDIEKREIRINKGEIDYEKERCHLKWPEDFDDDLISKFVKSFIAVRGLRRTTGTEEILKINYLGTINRGKFEPNIACALLFAQDPRAVIPGARLRFMRFDGTREGAGAHYNMIRDERIDGPIPFQIAQSDRIVSDQMRNFTRLGKDGKFQTSPEYPPEVWLEAIVNACVHRSYNLKNMNVVIKMFDDRLCVESPGGFPPPTTAETIYESQNPRNPHLMEALFYLDFVKCANEGTRRMRDMMVEANLPEPEFSQAEISGHQVRVVLRNKFEHRKTYVDAEASPSINEETYATLSEEEKIAINYLAEHGRMSVSDASRVLAVHWQSAKSVMTGLVKRGLLVRRSKTGKKGDPSARYFLKKPAR